MNEEIMAAGAAKPARTLDMVTAEIKFLDAQAGRLVMGHALEIGRRLREAKDLVPYGEWGEYLEKQLGYTQTTANKLMKVFDEYGASQMGLFGPEVESETFTNLTYSKALALLSVPREEREAFAQAVDAEHLSTRELQQAIRERDEARKAQAEAEQAAVAAKAKAEQELKKAKEQARAEREKLEAQLKEAEGKIATAGEADRAEADKLRAETEGLRKQLAMSGEAVTIFKLRFTAWQDAYSAMQDALDKVPEEQQTKLAAAVEAQLKAWRAE